MAGGGLLARTRRKQEEKKRRKRCLPSAGPYRTARSDVLDSSPSLSLSVHSIFSPFLPTAYNLPTTAFLTLRSHRGHKQAPRHASQLPRPHDPPHLPNLPARPAHPAPRHPNPHLPLLDPRPLTRRPLNRNRQGQLPHLAALRHSSSRSSSILERVLGGVWEGECLDCKQFGWVWRGDGGCAGG